MSSRTVGLVVRMKDKGRDLTFFERVSLSSHLDDHLYFNLSIYLYSSNTLVILYYVLLVLPYCDPSCCPHATIVYYSNGLALACLTKWLIANKEEQLRSERESPTL